MNIQRKIQGQLTMAHVFLVLVRFQKRTDAPTAVSAYIILLPSDSRTQCVMRRESLGKHASKYPGLGHNVFVQKRTIDVFEEVQTFFYCRLIGYTPPLTLASNVARINSWNEASQPRLAELVTCVVPARLTTQTGRFQLESLVLAYVALRVMN